MMSVCRTHFKILLCVAVIAQTACKQQTISSKVSDVPSDAGAAAAAAVAASTLQNSPVFHTAREVRLYLDNDEAFRSKIALIRGAKKTIDMAYWGFESDYTGSMFLREVFMRAKEGIKIRLILNPFEAIKLRPILKGVVANSGGNIQIAYYRFLPEELTGFLSKGDVRDEGNVAQEFLDGRVDQVFGRFIQVTKEKSAQLWPTLASLFSFRVTNQETVANAGFISDFLKRMHTKLMVVDGQYVVGGGRNVGDDYHLRKGHKYGKPLPEYYMDTDYWVDSSEIAQDALRTMNSLWDCIGNKSCEAGIPLSLEQTVTDVHAYDDDMAKFLTKGRLVTEKLTYDNVPPEIPSPHFIVQNARVAYVENRMFTLQNSPEKIDEPSHYTATWVNIINATQPGEDLIFHNLFIYLPPSLFTAVAHALQRGVKITFLTNHAALNEDGFCSVLGRGQYIALQKYAAKFQNHIDIYEYVSGLKLHSKVTSTNRALLVGSANADPHSEFMDAQNGILFDTVQDASGAVDMPTQYRMWLKGMVADMVLQKKIIPITGAVISTERETWQAGLASRALIPILDYIQTNYENALKTVDKPAPADLGNLLYLQL